MSFIEMIDSLDKGVKLISERTGLSYDEVLDMDEAEIEKVVSEIVADM